MQKKLMILGGSKFILPLIKKAHELGVFVITCDYLPDNIAHKYSDQYVNVSIIEKEKVLKVAQELKIDGITSFACDPGVVTAAYVAEKMGLPNVGPYESVCILQDKKLFRTFLKENEFNVPWFFSYESYNETLSDVNKYTYPLIVKPTDSAGSKGVTRVDKEEDFKKAFEYAKKYSLSGHVIVEEFLEKVGSSSSSDSFSLNGKLIFPAFSDQQFDVETSNVYNPCGTIFPTSLPVESQINITNELQRLITLLDMKTTIYNVECRLCTNGKEYLMEVSPRGGGNKIAELQSIAYDFDYIDIVVKSVLGLPFELKQPKLKYPSMTYVPHSNKNGYFKELIVSDEIKPFLIGSDVELKDGDYVESFTGANKSLGTMFFKFDTIEELRYFSTRMNKMIKVIIDEQ